MFLFTYGTLKRNKSAYYLMLKAGGSFVKEAQTHGRYHLMRHDSDFPCMVETAKVDGGVYGEVHEIASSKGFAILDQYECVNSGLFERKEIELHDGEKVQAYLYAQSVDGFTEIESGVWE